MTVAQRGAAPFPGMKLVEFWAWTCERCGHIWLPRDRSNAPKVCPECKSPYWDRPRKAKR